MRHKVKIQLNGYVLFAVLFLVVPTGLSSCFMVLEDRPKLTNSNTGPYLTSLDNLALVKALIRERAPNYENFLSELRKDADSRLEQELLSVTFKEKNAPHSTPQDYVSMATYAWPDPDKENGLPYITIDGEVNEEIYDYDRESLARLSASVEKLALAWYFTEEDKYAEKVANLVRTWFLDEDTRMNPHFQYAQFWPGESEGGLQGIIEARDFIPVIEAVSLIYDSNAWSPEDHRELKYWFYDFMRWIMGRYNSDAYAEYNIGTWIDAQKTIYALFTEQSHLLYSEKFITPLDQRLDKQVTRTGEQPRELSRMTAPHYTWLNLKGYIYQAEMRTHNRVLPPQFEDSSIYTAEGSEGSLRAALDWLLPFIAGDREWDNNRGDFSDFNHCRYIDLYRPAGNALEDERYEAVVQKLLQDPDCHSNITLLTHPPLETGLLGTVLSGEDQQ